MDTDALTTPERITERLDELRASGAGSALLPPFSDMFEHFDRLNPFIYCYFVALKRHGVHEINRYAGNNATAMLRIFNNENNYYQLIRKVPTRPSLARSIAFVRLAREFDVFDYYEFDVGLAAETARRITAEKSTTEFYCSRQLNLDAD